MQSIDTFVKGALALALLCPVAYADEWEPINPDELKMTSEPKAPGATAIVLYRQVDRDDSTSVEETYLRIKILSDEGRKYADVEIPYNKATERVRAIQARTIRPDGSVLEFDGQIFEKPIVKGRGVKLMAKSFTFADVQVGAIIEYKYRHELQPGYVFDSNWLLSDELFTRHAKFSLRQSEYFNVRYSWPIGLPPGTDPPKMERGRIRLETRDVPAVVTEDYMPPENELKYRVDFIYFDESNMEKKPADFWKKLGKQRYKMVSSFINERRTMEQAVAQTVASTDSAETKLRKLYACVQQLRNTSFEREKSDAELARDKDKDAGDVGDVWKRGYGNGLELTWLYLALVRAAGIAADPVLVSSRDQYFFHETTMNPYQLNTNIVAAKVDGKEIFLDPGTALAPFGLLPWAETGVRGLRLTKDGGEWLDVPLPEPDASRTVRKAEMQLLSNGSLEGKVTITYTGLEALWRRLEERNEDDTDRRQFLEGQINSYIPTGINVKLTNSPDWTNPEAPLIAEFELKIPGWASAVGQRVLMNFGIFGEVEKHAFEGSMRVHPIYFAFRNMTFDDIDIVLPSGWQVGSLPQFAHPDLKALEYRAAAEAKAGNLHLTRQVTYNTLLLDKKYYPQIREFFQKVRESDEQQLVINLGKPAPRK